MVIFRKDLHYAPIDSIGYGPSENRPQLAERPSRPDDSTSQRGGNHLVFCPLATRLLN
jgi:hypothetical protein